MTKTIYGKKTYNGKIYNTEHYTFNRDGFSNLSINEWCNELANTQKNKVIVSVSGDTPQKVVRYCEILQNIGIDKFELCFSCSNLGGEPICYDIRKLERFCKYVRRYVLSNISVKVVLSLSQKTNIDMVKTIAYCGMNAVTISDTIPALVLDKNKKAMFGGVGGLSGSFLKPLVLKALNDIQH